MSKQQIIEAIAKVKYPDWHYTPSEDIEGYGMIQPPRGLPFEFEPYNDPALKWEMFEELALEGWSEISPGFDGGPWLFVRDVDAIEMQSGDLTTALFLVWLKSKGVEIDDG